MVPEGTSAQDPPSDSDESIRVRIEHAHRQTAHSILKELAEAQEPSRIRELLDPLPETRPIADIYCLEERGSG